jgi:hypothetical protein
MNKHVALSSPAYSITQSRSLWVLLSQSYHLGGMGCSNGVVAIGLVRDLLKVC